LGFFAVKIPSSHNNQNFTTKAAKGAAKVHKEAWNTLASRHFLCALCADLEFFALKNASKAFRFVFTTKHAEGAATFTKF